jgi:hypothetical protein
MPMLHGCDNISKLCARTPTTLNNEKKRNYVPGVSKRHHLEANTSPGGGRIYLRAVLAFLQIHYLVDP